MKMNYESTRRSLLTRLKNWDDQAGWQRFFDVYWKLLFSVARRSGLNEADAEDVVQETVIIVAQQMPKFHYDPERGSFKNWLLLITKRRIIQQVRKGQRKRVAEPPAPREDETTDFIERIPDPESAKVDEAWEREWQKTVLQAAYDQIKGRVEPRQLQIFDCATEKGWSTEQIEKTFKVTSNHIYVIKHRVAGLLKAEVDRLETEMI